MKLLRHICLIFGLSFLSFGVFAMEEEGIGIVVVANIKDANYVLSKQQIRRLFMGSSIGLGFKVVTLPKNSITRATFNTRVIGLTEARIQSYWTQMRFSGRKKQPKALQNEKELIQYLIDNEGTVAYFSTLTPIPKSLQIIYQLDEI